MELPLENCLRYSSADASGAMRHSISGIFSVTGQTAQFSAIPANARGRRAVVFVMLFAWLAWLLTCPNVIDGVSSLVPAGMEHITHAAADSTQGTAHDDACCTAAQHAAVLATAQKFSLTTYFILTFVLPVMVTFLTALVAATSNRGVMRSSKSDWTRNPPFFWTLWPQAPPR